MDACVEEVLQTLTDIAEIGGCMKRETKEEMPKAVSALKNYFTVQEKATDSTMSFATTHHSTNHQIHANVHSVRDTT